MVEKGVEPSRKLARMILVVGVSSDALALSLDSYYIYGLVLLVSVVIGIIGTLIGSVMWARRASNDSVAAAVVGIVMFLFLYGNRVKMGFDDERIAVFPFALLVIMFLVIARVIGRRGTKKTA